MAKAILRGDGSTAAYVATADLTEGDIVAVTDLVGVVMEQAVANGATTEVSIKGTYEITKTTASDTWSAGAKLAVSSGTVAASVTGNCRAWNATTNGATTAWIVINQYAGDT